MSGDDGRSGKGGKPGEGAGKTDPPPVPRRGLRRSRPISVVPEMSDVDQGSERRRRFFTRAMSGDSGVQSASGVRRRWRWFRPGRAETLPPSEMTDTEARAEAAKSAAAELRSHLKQSTAARFPPVSRAPSAQPAPGSGTSTRNPAAPRPSGKLDLLGPDEPSESTHRRVSGPDPSVPDSNTASGWSIRPGPDDSDVDPGSTEPSADLAADADDPTADQASARPITALEVALDDALGSLPEPRSRPEAPDAADGLVSITAAGTPDERAAPLGPGRSETDALDEDDLDAADLGKSSARPGLPSSGDAAARRGLPASGDAARLAQPASGDATRLAQPASGDATRLAQPASGDAARPGLPASGDAARPGLPASGDAARPGLPGSGDAARPAQPASGDAARPRGESPARSGRATPASSVEPAARSARPSRQSEPGTRQPGEPGTTETDPAALEDPRSAWASGLRRWRRPLNELLRPPAWQRYDLLVVAAAVALFLTGAVAQRRIIAPSLRPVSQLGLHLSRPSGWLPPRRVGRPTAGLPARADVERGADLGAGDEDDPVAAALPYHIVIQSALDTTARLEIRIAERPSTGNLRSALVLERVSRHGEAHWAAASTDRTIGGRDWVRTEYRYAFKASKTDAPRIATGIEYAIVNGRLLYTVTLHGTGETARRLEALLVPTLSVDANHPAVVGGR